MKRACLPAQFSEQFPVRCRAQDDYHSSRELYGSGLLVARLTPCVMPAEAGTPKGTSAGSNPNSYYLDRGAYCPRIAACFPLAACARTAFFRAQHMGGMTNEEIRMTSETPMTNDQ